MKYNYREFTQVYVALGDGSAVKRKGSNLNMLFLFALKSAPQDEIAVVTYESYQIEQLACSIPAGMAVETAHLMPDCEAFWRNIKGATFFENVDEALSFLAR